MIKKIRFQIWKLNNKLLYLNINLNETDMKATIKQVFESDNWIITAVINGLNSYRVDAKRRFPIADEPNFFSQWGSKSYIERLARENYGKKVSQLNSFRY